MRHSHKKTPTRTDTNTSNSSEPAGKTVQHTKSQRKRKPWITGATILSVIGIVLALMGYLHSIDESRDHLSYSILSEFGHQPSETLNGNVTVYPKVTIEDIVVSNSGKNTVTIIGLDGKKMNGEQLDTKCTNLKVTIKPGESRIVTAAFPISSSVEIKSLTAVKADGKPSEMREDTSEDHATAKKLVDEYADNQPQETVPNCLVTP